MTNFASHKGHASWKASSEADYTRVNDLAGEKGVVELASVNEAYFTFNQKLFGSFMHNIVLFKLQSYHLCLSAWLLNGKQIY